MSEVQQGAAASVVLQEIPAPAVEAALAPAEGEGKGDKSPIKGNEAAKSAVQAGVADKVPSPPKLVGVACLSDEPVGGSPQSPPAAQNVTNYITHNNYADTSKGKNSAGGGLLPRTLAEAVRLGPAVLVAVVAIAAASVAHPPFGRGFVAIARPMAPILPDPLRTIALVSVDGFESYVLGGPPEKQEAQGGAEGGGADETVKKGRRSKNHELREEEREKEKDNNRVELEAQLEKVRAERDAAQRDSDLMRGVADFFVAGRQLEKALRRQLEEQQLLEEERQKEEQQLDSSVGDG